MDAPRALGWAFIAYAMIAYPLIGLWSGHRPGELPMFGIAPCPVTLFSFGVLLPAAPPLPRWFVVVPITWFVIGGSAAFLLAVPQDWLLLFSGVATALALRSRRTGTMPRQAEAVGPNVGFSATPMRFGPTATGRVQSLPTDHFVTATPKDWR